MRKSIETLIGVLGLTIITVIILPAFILYFVYLGIRGIIEFVKIGCCGN